MHLALSLSLSSLHSAEWFAGVLLCGHQATACGLRFLRPFGGFWLFPVSTLSVKVLVHM